MRKSRFSEQQIIAVLREQGRRIADGATTADVCRRHGVSEQTFCRWKAKYGGMGGEPLSAIGPMNSVQVVSGRSNGGRFP